MGKKLHTKQEFEEIASDIRIHISFDFIAYPKL